MYGHIPILSYSGSKNVDSQYGYQNPAGPARKGVVWPRPDLKLLRCLPFMCVEDPEIQPVQRQPRVYSVFFGGSSRSTLFALSFAVGCTYRVDLHLYGKLFVFTDVCAFIVKR